MGGDRPDENNSKKCENMKTRIVITSKKQAKMSTLFLCVLGFIFKSYFNCYFNWTDVDLHGLWTQPLGSKGVAVFVIFSCPLDLVLLLKFQLLSNSANRVLNWSFRSDDAATSVFKRTSRRLCNSLNHFAIKGALLNHVVSFTMPSCASVCACCDCPFLECECGLRRCFFF